MNADYQAIRAILTRLRDDYAGLTRRNVPHPTAPITERDIVAEIYCRLKSYCQERALYVHCEIKPAPSTDVPREQLRRLPKLDVAILKDLKGRLWLEEATKIQNGYAKGGIESRFSAVPSEFIHTAIEVKIQSNTANSMKDVDILSGIGNANKACNCFFVLLNARGQRADHEDIIRYAREHQVDAIEYTGDGSGGKPNQNLCATSLSRPS